MSDAASSASTANGSIVIASEHSETNLRWAANSLTTNGEMRSRSVTVISTFDHAAGTSAGVVTRSVAAVEEIDDLVRASEAARAAAPGADDVAPLVRALPQLRRLGRRTPATTGVEVFASMTRRRLWGTSLPSGRGRLSGPVRIRSSTSFTSTFLGTFYRTGAAATISRRTCRVERQVGRPHQFGLGRRAHPRLQRRRHRRPHRRPRTPARLGATSLDLPPGATRPSCRPAPSRPDDLRVLGGGGPRCRGGP